MPAMQQVKSTFEAAELLHVTDILMGAAHADGDLDGVEVETVRGILVRLAADGALSNEVEARLAAFDPGAFDLATACAALRLAGSEARRQILGLVGEVSECNDIHDLDESAYIRRVAVQLGATPEEYRSLVVDVLGAPPPVKR